MSNFHSTILWRSFLLTNILHESYSVLKNNECKPVDADAIKRLAFRIGLFGLETPRTPAISKALEVKLINQEHELLNLLKKLELGEYEMGLLKERAIRIKESGVAYSQSQRALYYSSLPVVLCSFIFDAASSVERRSPQTKWRIGVDSSLGLQGPGATIAQNHEQNSRQRSLRLVQIQFDCHGQSV